MPVSVPLGSLALYSKGTDNNGYNNKQQQQLTRTTSATINRTNKKRNAKPPDNSPSGMCPFRCDLQRIAATRPSQTRSFPLSPPAPPPLAGSRRFSPPKNGISRLGMNTAAVSRCCCGTAKNNLSYCGSCMLHSVHTRGWFYRDKLPLPRSFRRHLTAAIVTASDENMPEYAHARIQGDSKCVWRCICWSRGHR